MNNFWNPNYFDNVETDDALEASNGFEFDEPEFNMLDSTTPPTPTPFCEYTNEL
jgi:hypothetical protein